VYTGHFWLGPVDYAETQWHNACAPSVKYPPGIQSLYGDYIMGLANEVTLEGLSAGAGQLCDVCVSLKANGNSVVARVVTFGEETGPSDIDVSPELDAALDGASGRTATWQFVSCPTAQPIQYTFDGRQWDNTWFFRVWVRNSRLPVSQLEFRLGAAEWTTADWQGDGAWQASSQDFSAGFELRVTSIDGQTLTDEIPGLGGFDPDAGITSHGNFE
jgi:expansin (peptidoglycan-binding protein)